MVQFQSYICARCNIGWKLMFVFVEKYQSNIPEFADVAVQVISLQNRKTCNLYVSNLSFKEKYTCTLFTVCSNHKQRNAYLVFGERILCKPLVHFEASQC